ncbi:MAG: single-stranded DNA-binding protein [Clostridia bacterium]|nr:single-stranded DNA-binding protein [Clostridia bacterium]
MLNKVMLMGRLTRDPELRATQSGVSVVTFTLAVDRNFQRQGEERQADFINIVAFRHTAEFVKKYFVKGQLACVCGSIQTRTWEQDGKKNYATEVIADEVHFTGDRRDNSGNGYQTQQRPSNDGFVQDGPANDGFMTVEDDQLPF